MADNSSSGSSSEQPASLGQKAKSLLGVILKRPAPPPPPLETTTPQSTNPDSADAAPDAGGPSASEAPQDVADVDTAPAAQRSTRQDEYWNGLEKLKAASPPRIPGGGKQATDSRSRTESTPEVPKQASPKPPSGPAFGVGLFEDKTTSAEPVAEPVAETVDETA